MNHKIKVCSLESRRAEEMKSLISRMGGDPFVAPSMREVPLDKNDHVIRFAENLLAGRFEIVTFMTGVGARGMIEILQDRFSQQAIFSELNKRMIIVRGPKPTSVLKEWGVKIDYRAPEPNTWRELVTMIDNEKVDMKNKELALQEYGKPNARLEAELTSRGAVVTPVAVYKWELPEDITLLKQAIEKLTSNEFDLIMFTSAQQVYHLLQVAEEMNLREAVKISMLKTPIASIGPTCTEALLDEGFISWMEPSHPKMGQLVKEALEKFKLSSAFLT